MALTTTTPAPTPAPLSLPEPNSPPAPAAPSALRAPSEKSQRDFATALPSPRARLLFKFCTQIVIGAILSLMVWIGEACTTRDPDLKRFRLLQRYFNLTLKVLRTVQDKPERLTLAQLAWLRRAAKFIQSLVGRPLDFSSLADLAKPTKPAKPENPKSPDDPGNPDSQRSGSQQHPDPQQRPAQRRPLSPDHCPPVPDELDAKYVKAPGRVLVTVCANLVRLMNGSLPVAPVRERIKQELEIAQKEADPRQVSELGWAAFTRAVFEFIRPAASPTPASPVPPHHPPP